MSLGLVKIVSDPDFGRCAYDLDVLISKQPGPRPNQRLNAGKVLASNELEYLDVFDLFNLPCLILPVPQDVSPGKEGLNQVPLPDLIGMNELNITNYLIPTPESD